MTNDGCTMMEKKVHSLLHAISTNRRLCLKYFTLLTGASGVGISTWHMISTLGKEPDNKDNTGFVDVSLINIKEGETIKRICQGKLIFIHHRTQDEIALARNADKKTLIAPQSDSERVKAEYPQWLIVEGICPHAGCVPEINIDEKKGWYCPCHGSEFDTSGRVIRGPAAENLPVPDYVFHPDGLTVRIGVRAI